MEWWAVLAFFIGGLIFLLLLGQPIAFAFLLMDVFAVLIFMGPLGLEQITLNIASSISTFVLVPVPLFIFMGELMFHSQIAPDTIETLDGWLGRLPGRLSLLAATSGTLFAATSGSTMANTAMLGTILLPEMKKRGYSTAMSVGPIIGVGGIAMLIPPSALAVVLAAIGQISVGRILMGGVIPGLILSAFFIVYIVMSAWLRPAIAPPYVVAAKPLVEKIVLSIKYFVPMAFIIFMVIGLIILGIATPTEAAASGVIATLVVILVYGRLSWPMLRAALKGSVQISVMIFMIIAASKTFSSVLSFTQASSGLLGLVKGLEVHPLLILITMQVILIFMGTFMDAISIMMICLPVFMPISHVLGFDPVWFGILMLINLELGQITPPFGMLLFVMKGVAPAEVTIEEICWAAVPYILFDLIVMAMVIAWPQLALWLPNLLRG
jgi:tripartite ATP-independent transporter DctM subunit